MLIKAAFDAVAGGQERIKALYETRLPAEQHRHTLDDAGRIDRLALKVLHDIEESIVHIRVVRKLDLDLVEVRQGIAHIECRHGSRTHTIAHGLKRSCSANVIV